MYIERSVLHDIVMKISNSLIKPYKNIVSFELEHIVTFNSRLKVFHSSEFSHHALGVVSAVWVSASMLALEPN